MENIILGAILIFLGGLQVVRTDLMMKFQIWSQRVIMGAEFIPSSRTYKVIRIIGAVTALLGLLVITGILE